jgi:hypothetical protein
MATTTNYSWSTPDDTALVKDGAAAIRSLGTSIDTTTKALNPSTTLGDIEYRSSSANTNTRLGIGTTGQVLTVAGGVPSWATAAGGGKILQVVYADTTTQTAVNTTTYTDTTITASITPASASSRILILANVQFYLDINGAAKGMKIRLLRDSTVVFTDGAGAGNSSGITALGATAVAQFNRLPVLYVDSPNTTSSTTYKVQGAASVATGTLQFQDINIPSSIVLMEIGA